MQTSLYGASKLAGEGLIQAYCEGFGFQGYIFRFVSILGERYTHGHVFPDFYKQLVDHPGQLKVLGDGNQRKSYLHVDDCIAAILTCMEKSRAPFSIYNLEPTSIAGHPVHRVDRRRARLVPSVVLFGGSRGWVGDSPFNAWIALRSFVAWPSPATDRGRRASNTSLVAKQ